MPLHWPRHNYLGPGTRDFTKQPVDEDDEIARRHDISYQQATSAQDIFDSDSKFASEFWNEYKKNGRFESLVGAAGLKLKNVTEKFIGRPLYGMPPKKNWAAIRRINQHRAARRQNPYPIEEQEVPTGKEQLPSIQEQTEPELEMDSEPEPLPGSSGAPMEMVADQPRAAPNPGGVGGSLGGGGAPMGDIYGGSSQTPNKFTLRYSKSYHFTLSNGLPQWRRFAEKGHLEHQARYRAIHGIPWELLGMYLSEGEFERLQNYSYVAVKEVTCQVHSLGVRLPFVTGQSISTVANANAQYPIAKFHFDRDFHTMYEEENVANIIDKCRGTEWKDNQIDTSTNWSDTFPNLTASTTSRDMNNPVIVVYPRYTSLGFNTQENYPKDVGIYDYCNIKNGSTAFGLAWEMKHKPKQGIIWAPSNPTFGPEAHFINTNNANQYTPYVGERANFIANTELLVNRMNAFLPTSEWSTSRNHDGIRGFVDNNLIFAVGDEKVASKAMPKFMIGFVNIRNEDDSLLTAKWDILIKCSIELDVIDNGQRGFISRHSGPVPYIMDPFLSWQNDSYTNNLHPSMTMLNTVYNKRASQRRVNTRYLKTLDKKFIQKLKETEEGKKLIEEIETELKEEIKEAKILKNKLAKHKHPSHETAIQNMEEALKNLE